MTARIVNAIARTIATVNSNRAGFGFGAMGPLLARQIDVALLDFRGAKRKRCVSCFTLRWDMIPHTDNCCSMATRPEGDGDGLGAWYNALLRGVEAPSASCPRELHPKKSGLSPRNVWPPFSTIVPKRGTGLRIGKATLSLMQRRLVSSGGLIMTKRRDSTTARSVPSAPEQLFDVTQEYIRLLIGLIDRLHEVGAEDELRVITKQLTRLVYRAQSH